MNMAARSAENILIIFARLAKDEGALSEEADRKRAVKVEANRHGLRSGTHRLSNLSLPSNRQSQGAIARSNGQWRFFVPLPHGASAARIS